MNKPGDSGSGSLLRSSTRLHQRRSLQEANDVSQQLSGNQLHQSQDPHGQVLRQLRQSLQLDPSSVATQACISLGQLYELETGGRRLFYSETLRHQAARRVAGLLGSDWDAIVAGRVQPKASTAAAATATAAPAHTGGQVIALRPNVERAQPSSGIEAPTSLVQTAAAKTATKAAPTQAHPPAGTSLLSTPDVGSPTDLNAASPSGAFHDSIDASVTARPQSGKTQVTATAPHPPAVPSTDPNRHHHAWRAVLGVLFVLALVAAAWRTGLIGGKLPL